MPMTHARAARIVARFALIGPAHGTIPGDFDRVRTALETEPTLVEALNALDPRCVEETPQGAAAHMGCREILDCMLRKGVRLDIFMACALGLHGRVRRFLDEEPHLANAHGGHGIHILNHASDREIVRMLLDRGADPNDSVYPPWGWTPTHEAAAQGRLEVVELLVAHGGAVGESPTGTTPMHAAARVGHLAVIQWLLDQGANPRSCGVGGPWERKLPVQVAIEYRHHEIAELLRQADLSRGDARWTVAERVPGSPSVQKHSA